MSGCCTRHTASSVISTPSRVYAIVFFSPVESLAAIVSSTSAGVRQTEQPIQVGLGAAHHSRHGHTLPARLKLLPVATQMDDQAVVRQAYLKMSGVTAALPDGQTTPCSQARLCGVASSARHVYGAAIMHHPLRIICQPRDSVLKVLGRAHASCLSSAGPYRNREQGTGGLLPGGPRQNSAPAGTTQPHDPPPPRASPERCKAAASSKTWNSHTSRPDGRCAPSSAAGCRLPAHTDCEHAAGSGGAIWTRSTCRPPHSMQSMRLPPGHRVHSRGSIDGDDQRRLMFSLTFSGAHHDQQHGRIWAPGPPQAGEGSGGDHAATCECGLAESAPAAHIAACRTVTGRCWAVGRRHCRWYGRGGCARACSL